MPLGRPLLADAQRIWRAGVEACLPDRLLQREVIIEHGWLAIGDWQIELDTVGRISVVGAGKAGAAMVLGLEAAMGPELLAAKRVSGWVNIPAGTTEPTQAIHLHAGRPAGVNEPRPEGVEGTRQILREVASLGPNDLCLCLISGGGSALLPAPVAGVSLDQKIAITRLLSASGATIEQLNCVRRQLSEVKGGGLARACTAGTLVTLIVSDVLGDPLDNIASGPTFATRDTAADAVAVLNSLGLVDHPDARPIVDFLARKASLPRSVMPPVPAEVHHLILANNATAVDAAGIEAERLGYNHAMLCATHSEGPAEEIGEHLARMAIGMRDGPGPNCLITGGEPTVTLPAADLCGLGGRNQQLVLAAMEELGDCHGIALLSGGTDGEDGPTDAAGAMVDQVIARAAKSQGLEASDYLERCDAHRYFEPINGLLKTGPTGTNVCDIRVVVVEQKTSG